MDRLEAMSILLAVVEAGSLSAAGRRLGVPLATVSRKISDLERHLNARLVNRTSRRLALTEPGRAYVAACRRILDEVGEAEREAAGEFRAPKGDLVVTAPVVFGRLHVLPVVLEFLREFPQIDIRMVLADRIIHLLDDHVDVAVRIGELPPSGLVASRVGELRRVVCASPAYISRHGKPATPEALGAHQCVTFEGMSSSEIWVFRAGDVDKAITVHSRLVVNTAEAAVDAAVAGLGMARLLSYQIAAAHRLGELEIALAAFEPPPIPVSLVHAGQGRLPLKQRAFLDFAAPRLRAAIAACVLQDGPVP